MPSTVDCACGIYGGTGVLELASAASAATMSASFEAEKGFRWTSGDAVIPEELFAMSSACVMMLNIASTAQYLDEGERHLVA